MKINNKSNLNYITLNDDQFAQVKVAYDLLLKNELDLTSLMMIGIIISKLSHVQMLKIITDDIDKTDPVPVIAEDVLVTILQEDV